MNKVLIQYGDTTTEYADVPYVVARGVDNILKHTDCTSAEVDAEYYIRHDTKADNEIADDLIALGYPHNFQHERSDIVEYMYKVSDIIRKAFKLKEQKNDER